MILSYTRRRLEDLIIAPTDCLDAAVIAEWLAREDAVDARPIEASDTGAPEPFEAADADWLLWEAPFGHQGEVAP
jgi:hypothetical protein